MSQYDFDKRFCLEFHSVACRHHIYKKVWTPVNREKLACKHDTRAEAQLYDDYAVGIYLDEGEGIEIKLVGHVPIELSFLLCKFLARKGCHLEFSPTGSRYLEDELVVPGKYLASAEDRRLVATLKNELGKRAERLLHMSLIVKEIAKTRLTQLTVILKTKMMCFFKLLTLCFLFI